MVSTCIKSGDQVEINEGLSQGEAVVINGVYLINSKFIFKRGAPTMAVMASMKMQVTNKIVRFIKKAAKLQLFNNSKL